MVNLNISNQAQILENDIKVVLYQKLNDTAKKHKCLRLTSLGVALTSSAMSIVMRIALIFENVIKGLINIFGAPFSEKCSFKKGMKQVFFNVPKNLCILPFATLLAILKIPLNTFKMTYDPRAFTNKRYLYHHKIQNPAPPVQNEAQLDPFKHPLPLKEQNYPNVEQLYVGRETQKPIQEDIYLTAKKAIKEKKFDVAIPLYEKAVLFGRSDANFLLAKCYEKKAKFSDTKDKDLHKATECYKAAAEQYHVESALILAYRACENDQMEEVEKWIRFVQNTDVSNSLLKMFALNKEKPVPKNALLSLLNLAVQNAKNNRKLSVALGVTHS